MARRTTPLHAPAEADAAGEVEEFAPPPDEHAAADQPLLPPPPRPVAATDSEANRLQRLADGVRNLRAGGGTLNLNERILMVLGGILAPLGLVLVLLGWQGAAHTPNLFEQIPYLISGGLLGVGLVFLGSFFYFTHWLTELVKEHRAQSAAVVEAITRLESAMERAAVVEGNGHVATGAGSGSLEPAVAMVVTEKGTMAHRPDCVVVAGKQGVRAVEPGETLATCKLCS